MRCPFPIGGVHPCRKCISCRINERRLWTHRIILENMLHPSSVFCTLTYDDDHLPESKELIGVLKPDDTKNFLKRLRKVAPNGKIRYYLAGEYGDQTMRPHYHLILFNFPLCAWGGTRHSVNNRRGCCASCDLIRSAWGKGAVELGDVTPESAQYTAGYTVKKMTREDDLRLQRGNSFLPPEFSRKSLKPGLGAGMMPYIADIPFIMDMGGDDVPSSLRHGKKILPLGRYLKGKLRESLQVPAGMPAKEQLRLDYQTLFPLRILAKNSSTPLSQVILESTGDTDRQLNKRQQIQQSRKRL